MSRFMKDRTPPYQLLKITPHRSVTNATTRKLQRSIHELLSTTHVQLPWQHKEGLYILKRQKPSMWWVTQLTGGEINFYVALPKDLVDTFLIKVQGFDPWKRSTIEEASMEELLFSEDHTDLYRAEYTLNNMFSLDYDYKEQQTPLKEILNVSNELQEDEHIQLFIRTEAVTKKKWKQLTDYAWKQWNAGKMVHRDAFNIQLAFRSVSQLIVKFFQEVRDIVLDLMEAVENTVFKDGKKTERPAKSLWEDPDRKEILAEGGPSKRTKQKRTLPALDTYIYYTVKSKDPVKRESLARGIESSLAELNGDNKLKPLKINIGAKKGLNSLSTLSLKSGRPNKMSIDEVGKLEQLPTRELQEEFGDKLEANKNIEIEVAKSFLDQNGIYAGTATLRDQTLNIHIPVADPDMTFTARAFIGSPRMGKDQCAINQIVEANRKHGIGAIIPDVIDERKGHRGMADAIRDHLDPANVIDLNLGDFDFPIYLGLQGLAKGSNERIASNRIAQELTNFLMGDDIENHQTREYLREFAKATQGDLIGIKLMCLSGDYRTNVIQDLKEKGWDTLMLEQFHSLTEGRQQQIVNPILIRMGELLNDEFLKPIFGQRANPDVDLQRWMQEGKVVIFRIPSRDLGEQAVKTIVYWIVLLSFLTRLKMAGDNKGVFVVLNEPHQFLTKGLIHFTKRLLAEGPKYRMAPIFLLHNFRQLPKDFVEILLSSSLNWNIFKNSNIKVYQELQTYLSPTFTPEEALQSTKRFHFIACWLNQQGEYEAPFMVKAPDLVSKRYKTEDNTLLTKQHSRKYGKPVKDILQEIQSRQRVIYAQKGRASS